MRAHNHTRRDFAMLTSTRVLRAASRLDCKRSRRTAITLMSRCWSCSVTDYIRNRPGYVESGVAAEEAASRLPKRRACVQSRSHSLFASDDGTGWAEAAGLARQWTMNLGRDSLVDGLRMGEADSFWARIGRQLRWEMKMIQNGDDSSHQNFFQSRLVHQEAQAKQSTLLTSKRR